MLVLILIKHISFTDLIAINLILVPDGITGSEIYYYLLNTDF